MKLELRNDSFEYVIYIPKHNEFIYIQEGSGDQLTEEDYENGFNTYVDYEVYVNGKFDDGGLYVYNDEEVDNWIDKIQDAIDDFYGEEDLDYVIVADEKFEWMEE